LEELCPRISRTSFGSNRREPNSRSRFDTGRGACAAFRAALSWEIGYKAKVGDRRQD